MASEERVTSEEGMASEEEVTSGGGVTSEERMASEGGVMSEDYFIQQQQGRFVSPLGGPHSIRGVGAMGSSGTLSRAAKCYPRAAALNISWLLGPFSSSPIELVSSLMFLPAIFPGGTLYTFVQRSRWNDVHFCTSFQVERCTLFYIVPGGTMYTFVHRSRWNDVHFCTSFHLEGNGF